ncbi:MAG TPA: hypothetical protein PL193_11335 [Xanthobacteraceae bacterium]|nr:hypothetical protein [Xanthobacteraceae bacterium]
MSRIALILIVLIALPFAGQVSGQTGPASPRQTPRGECLAPEQFFDEDGDVMRNRAALASRDLCLRLEVFTEGRLHWVLQVIQNRKIPNGPLWAVPHDDEDVAFDSAVYAVQRYGGTVVAVEQNHDRYNRIGRRKQDPNRNFQIRGQEKCQLQLFASPIFTRRFMQGLRKGQPIIALHTNKQGFDPIPVLDEEKSKGNVSIGIPRKADSNITEFPAPRPMRARSPDDTLIYVASLLPPDADGQALRFVTALNAAGIHVLYEHVRKNDCSLSNYAVRHAIPYTNLEVVDGDDTGAQTRMIDVVLRLMRAGEGPLAPGR